MLEACRGYVQSVELTFVFFYPQIGVPGCDPTGYHAKRNEFDHEYDNDAEMLISEISFNSTDTKV